MTSSKFIAALRKLKACITARHEIHYDQQSLEDFWLDTERADWMLWLLVRVGLWGRVSDLVNGSLSDDPDYEGVKEMLLHRLSQDRQWSAANESSGFFEDEENIDGYDPEVFAEWMRNLVTWDEIEAAIHITIQKEVAQ